MKIALYLINAILAISILYQGSKFFTSKPEKKATKVKVEKKNTPKKSTAKVSVKPVTPPVDEVKTITQADLFNNKRNPSGNSFFGRVELSLVGTFKVGKNEGAIIIQKSNQRRPFMSMMGTPRAGATPMMPMGGGFRQRFALNNNNTQNQGTKQYVRIGETLSNGYTLAAITRTSATLTRNGEKMELELQDPSKNQNQSRSNRNRQPNAQQQLQWAQLQTQRQLMYMMMNMQRNNYNNNNNAARPTNQGNRGRRR